MKRIHLIAVLGSFALAASLAGCGNTNNAGDSGGANQDLSMPGGGHKDMTGGDGPVTIIDLTVPIQLMTHTGDACKANADCPPSKAGASKAPQCLKTDAMSKLVYPGGYCTSPCRPAQTDPGTGLNSDCPSDSATCELVSQTAGRCVALCMAAASDCRETEGYECENNTPYAASCTPKGPNWCDPKMPKSCPKAADGNDQLCTDFSPDMTYGNCTEICDPFLQNCPNAMNPLDCIATPSTGVATCIGASGNGMLDAPCRYLNDCSPGFQCHAKKGGMGLCVPFCRVGTGKDAGVANADAGEVGDVACPANHNCVDLKTGMPGNTKLGICEM